ncbi:MAG TPA: SRPBCC family protein [Candidatus Limnocylindria bacterium]
MKDFTAVKASSRVAVACTPAAAFAYVSDITTHPHWSPDNIRVLKAPDGPPALGARYRTVGFSVVAKTDVEADLEVTAFEPPHRFVFVASNGPRTFENVFTFTPSDGGTLVERTISFMAPSQALDGLKAVDREVTLRRDKALQMLKERLEQK